MGHTVVSGLAYGVDQTAHRGALLAGGPTIAVMPCGVDRPYPAAHALLLEAIADRGLVADFEKLAMEKKIPFQRTMLRAGGQDGAAAQQAAAGARAIGIVVGTRYIHTVTEMIHKTDLAAARDILVAYLKAS